MHTTPPSSVLVCLHGWGGSKESFIELRAALEGSGITMLTTDLPGFGEEPEPPKPWTTDDYADWVEAFIKKNVQGPFHLLGHSHGGRIALKLAQRQCSQRSQLTAHSFHIAHLYLCAAAGIRHPRHIKRIIGLTLAKLGKSLLKIPGLRSLQPLGKKLLYKLVRVHDYEQASPVMRQTLINVSREDLCPILKEIKVATDIFWGKDDGMTPFSDALVMKRKISGSELHAFDGVRHRVHRDRAAEIAAIIKSKISA
jgi:pimeloyl-ACP methyl ester carboxylesterase